MAPIVGEFVRVSELALVGVDAGPVLETTTVSVDEAVDRTEWNDVVIAVVVVEGRLTCAVSKDTDEEQSAHRIDDLDGSLLPEGYPLTAAGQSDISPVEVRHEGDGDEDVMWAVDVEESSGV
jgi:hypothetical protein